MNQFHEEFVAQACLIGAPFVAVGAWQLTRMCFRPGVHRLARGLRGFVLRHHEEGLVHLAMDDMANDHYGLPTVGFAYRLWRCRVYLHAVLLSVLNLQVDPSHGVGGVRGAINRWLYRRWIR